MSEKPRILGPDGREVCAEGPRLVDAAGRPIRTESESDNEFRPRLRALEFSAVRDEKGDMLVAHDPLGVCEDAVALRMEVLPLLQLLDGTRSVADLAQQVVGESGDPAHADAVRRLIDDLDGLYLLESPKFEERRKKVADEYRREKVRPAVLAGVSYPATSDELRTFLGGHYAEAKAIREAHPDVKAPEPVRAVAIPHLDLRRAGATVALGMLAAPEQAPDVVFLYGTGHTLLQRTVAITGKSYETPLGKLETDGQVFENLLEKIGEDARDEETAHRMEHSLEFAALHLQYHYENPPRIVPVLFGGFHAMLLDGHRPESDTLYATSVAAIRAESDRLEQEGKRVLHLGAVDLSHVGARFGDRDPLDEKRLEDVRALDGRALDAALTGQPDAWFDTIASHGDSTKICGYSALHALLAVARPGPGVTLRYEQSPEPGGSVVTCASLAWAPLPQ